MASKERLKFTARLRAPVAHGIRAGHKGVDRDRGVLEGVAVITEGVAKGHGFAIDADFVQAVVDAGEAQRAGLKCRFGHPNASSSALGTFLGREKRFYLDRRDGLAIARADLYLSETAKKSPKGDLYEYVLDLAEKEPDMFGTSIVFTWSNMYRRDGAGEKVFWKDDQGKENAEFFKLRGQDPVPVLDKLSADDVVDSPAANEGGLFSDGYSDQVAAQMTELLDAHPALLGFLAEHPDLDEFLRDNEVIGPFLERYETNKTPERQTEENPMANEQDKKTGEQLAEENAAALAAAKKEGADTAKGALSALKAAFADDLPYAVEAFEKGLTVDQAKAAYCDKLSQEVATLRQEVATLKAAKPADGEKPAEKPADGESLGADAAADHQEEPQTQSAWAAAVAEKMKAGLSEADAICAAAKDHPELADKLV